MTAFPILAATAFLPLAGAVAILLFPERFARWLALLTTLTTLGVSVPLYLRFDKTSSALQFVDSALWIPSWNVAFSLGVDGISLPFIFLSTVVSVVCVGASWAAVQTRVREFYAALLVAETAMVGVFAATNFFLFYVFWELMIVPMFLLIGMWGGPGRIYAAVKFLMFTLAGSVPMLVGLIVLLHAYGTLDFRELSETRLSLALQAWLFVAFTAAFGVKVPMFPVHTWLPDAHTEAPTAGSVILAGILLKMGGYGLLRIGLPILPDATQLFLTPMLLLSAVAIVYGAYVTLAQRDVKRLIAYSSISHMGFVTLGIFTLNRNGIEGADPPDGEPRHHHRSAFRVRGHDLRANAHAGALRLRRTVEARAALLDVPRALLPGCRRIPRTELFRWRAPHYERSLQRHRLRSVSWPSGGSRSVRPIFSGSTTVWSLAMHSRHGEGCDSTSTLARSRRWRPWRSSRW